MALPANVDLVTVTGTYVYVDGTPATGKVTFTPSLSSWIQDAGAPATLLPRTITATLDIAGKVSVPLPATDDPDLAPNGWTYDVVEDFGSGLTRQYAIGVPTSAGTIDLATVAPVTPVSGGSKVVTRVNGKVPDINGAVVLTPSDIGALPATYTPPAAPVQSVSGKTGIVLLTASDVGALPVDYPVVQSVNGKTGSNVSIGPAEIGAIPIPGGGAAQVGQLVSVSAVSGGVATGFELVDTAEITPADIGAQPADADLTAIAGLIPANDDFMQRKAGAWASRTAAQVKADLGIGGWKSPPAGRYFLPLSQGGSATSATLGDGTLRLVPWLVRGTVIIDRIVGDIATAGEAGSRFRMGIYADNGACYPGSLVVDAGQILGDSATVQELAIAPVTLQPGVYWLGGVVQAAPTTQPAVRVVSSATPDVPMSPSGTVLPASAGSATAYANVSVTGALPTTFGTGLAAVASGPRLFLRAA